jgi:DhnA family fructose-bisphosphate aldolase class Ia
MTYSCIGKRRRLNKLFDNGKTIVVPIDDSLIFGAKQGLLNLSETIEKIVKGRPNALLGFKKDIEILTEIDSNIPFIFNVTASTVLSTHTRKTIIASVDNAVAAGAECVAAHINFSSSYENEMIHNFATISNECDRLGVPLLAIAYPRSEYDEKDYNYDDLKTKDNLAYTELVAHIVRVVCELGADIIKTNYTGNEESFRTVVQAALGKPVIIAGGAKIPVEHSFQIVEGVINAGGSGISFGRNIFNADHITAYLNAIKTIVFKSEKWQTAFEKYNQTIGS